MRKYVMEGIGTFFLMLSIFLSLAEGLGNTAPIAIGATLMAMIYAGGHISKAHYNPAVSLAFLLCREMETKDFLPYWIAQLLGAGLAVSLGGILVSQVSIQAIEIEPLPSFLAEFLGTFALVFVILNVAIAKGTQGNPFYAVAIGLVVIGGAYVFGGISGAAFNPAVAMGISIAGMSLWAHIWIFLLANFTAAIVAAYVFIYVNN